MSSPATTALAGTLAVFFTGLGTAKIRAVPAMRQRAAHVGMSTAAYRRIGALEVAGLLALLGGALIAHRRAGDGLLRDAAPALVAALAVTAYLAALGERPDEQAEQHRRACRPEPVGAVRRPSRVQRPSGRTRLDTQMRR